MECYNKYTKYCYNNETTRGWIEHRTHSHQKMEQLRVEKEKNALCLPDKDMFHEAFMGGVYSKENVPLKLAFQRGGLKKSKELIEKSDLNNIVQLKGEYVYLGQYRRHYGSFLIDSISRLWVAIENPQKYRYIFLATQPELGIGLHQSAIEFLKLFGITENQIVMVSEPTRVESLIIPEMSYVPLSHWHKEYLDIIHKVVDNVQKPITHMPEKVYFSRSKFSSQLKSDFGEEIIVELFKSNGYKIIYPEEHTLSEQINYVNQCKVFASIGGSCAHNIIFSETAPQMILFNRMNGYQFHQWFLNEMANVEPITYVDAYNEPFKLLTKTNVNGPFLYMINKNVKMFAKDFKMTIPPISPYIYIRCLGRYTYYILRKTIKERLMDLCQVLGGK